MIEGLRPSWQTHVLIGRGEIFREYKVDGKAFSSNAIAQLLWQDPSCRAWCECYTCRCKCGVLGSQTTVHPSGHRLEKVKHIDTYFWPTDELLSKWEWHLVDSAVGFQSCWGVAQLWRDHFSLCRGVPVHRGLVPVLPSTCRVLWDKLIQRPCF